MLGLVLNKFPLADLSDATITSVTNVFLTTLRDQVESTRDKGPEMPVIAGALRGLESFLRQFPQPDTNRPEGGGT